MHLGANRTVISSTSMKIVSKFRDYYDSLRSLDRDDTPLYVRATTEHRLLSWRAVRASAEALCFTGRPTAAASA